MEWKEIFQKSDGSVVIPNNWLYIHYYEALNILFRFENTLRMFVYIILKNNLYDKWNDACITINNKSESIKSIAKSRISQAENFSYLSYEVSAPIMHLTSGELIELITNDSYWPLFKIYFKGGRQIMKNKLLEIGYIRNALAHFRPIKKDDIEVIKQNAKQTLLEIEKLLNEIFIPQEIVPSNCVEEWYTSLNQLSSDTTTFSFHQSKSTKWVRLFLRFTSLEISREAWSEKSIQFYVSKIKGPEVLKKYDNLRKYVTYSQEYIPNITLNDKSELGLKKYLIFVFNRDTLSKNLKDIQDDFKSLLKIISDETTLVKNDHLARGEIIEAEYLSAYYEDSQNKWSINKKGLYCDPQADSPEEYWTNVEFFHGDFITDTNNFPWMLSSISKSISLF
jgi:hypothetical protein